MSMFKLAVLNFKGSFKNYLSLIISLSFTVLILLNFQNIVFSDTLDFLGKMNKNHITIIIQSITFILVCFMLFFIWYSTNVFLNRRKKDIGIYVFMGLTNQKIGKLYVIETTLIGIISLVIGLVSGVIVTKLFQMILMAISQISVDIKFQFSPTPILITCIIYLIIYMLMVLKGYINIVRSSVLDMISANKQNEYVKTSRVILVLKTVAGVLILSAGYYTAIKDDGLAAISNALMAVVLVTVGVYLLFGGFIPFILQALAKNKKFLYEKERNLWVNNLIFRIRKNYRTYAIVSVLLLCSVTVLATSFAMKNKYDGIVHFRNTYTYQVSSNKDNIDSELKSLIQKNNDIKYSTKNTMLSLDASLFNTKYTYKSYSVIPYSQLKQLAKDANLELDVSELKDDEIMCLTQLDLMSFAKTESNITVTINNKKYKQIEETSVPYLGKLQEVYSLYVVNDSEYKKLMPLGKEVYMYNYAIKDTSRFKKSLKDLDSIVSETKDNYTSYIAVDPESPDIAWIKIMCSICVFLFMVFILASGSILFMKIYNDSFEEAERYNILSKLGISKKVLKKSIVSEMRFTYILPFIVMAISSLFSVKALSNVMEKDLTVINIVSLICILVYFYICYRVSIISYIKNANIE